MGFRLSVEELRGLFDFICCNAGHDCDKCKIRRACMAVSVQDPADMSDGDISRLLRFVQIELVDRLSS